MSSSLAIAGVTAALLDLLNNGMVDNDINPPKVPPNVVVSAVPPDHIGTGSGTEKDALNLFLYQVTPNLGWRNAGLPSRDSDGTRRLTNPPLALDLHYLLTAYGSKNMNAEILLGYGMEVLHKNPGLSRQQLRDALQNPTTVTGAPIAGVLGSLSALDLADQVEAIKVTPVFLTMEELSKLWTSMQARYRPSMAYMVSVVLIQQTTALRSPPPVLQRGKDDHGPIAQALPYPQLNRVRPMGSDQLPAVRLGEEIWVDGANFGDPSTFTARFVHSKTQTELLPAITEVLSPNLLKLTLPAPAVGMSVWPVGIYSLRLQTQIQDAPGHSITSSSNGIPVVLAPLITVSPLTHVHGNLNLMISCAPRLPDAREKTIVRLLFGDREIAPDTIDAPDPDPSKPTLIHFTVPSVPAQTAPYMVRLRMSDAGSGDGIDSLPVKITGQPPRQLLEIDPQQQVTVT